MSHDISDILQHWEFDPHELTVRVIKGNDGAERIQMRIELGLLQMHLHGRPDGKRPQGCESLLEYYEQQSADYGKGFHLVPDAIAELHREGYQYYQRYLCLYHLGYYDLVVRDTERNLRLFEFVKKSTRKRKDHWRFDQYRPYLLMMYTRADAMLALSKGQRAEAIQKILAGRKKILAFLNEYGKSAADGECFELEFLTRWAEELGSTELDDGEKLDDVDSVILDSNELKQLLQKAVSREDYETAAYLRDRLRKNAPETGADAPNHADADHPANPSPDQPA